MNFSKSIVTGFLALLIILSTTLVYGASGNDFKQCANDNALGSKNDGIIDPCDWINGALIPNNSDYAESDGVPQRFIFRHEGTGSDTHTVVFRYDFTKSNVYAYDFLVDPDHTMPSSLLNHCQNMPSFATALQCQTALANAINVPVISDTFDQVSVREHPPSRNILFGCASVGCTAQVVSIVHSTNPVSPIPMANCFQNCGDSFVYVTIQYSEPANNDLVVMWFAGELAPAFDPDGAGPQIGWGAGFGASSLPGASLDFRLMNINGDASGARTNQLQRQLLEDSHTSDLAVTKTDSPDPIIAGNNLTYTINVANNGTDTATDVYIDDTLPPGVTFISATPSQGACEAPVGNVLHCFIGFMNPGDIETVTVVVNVPAGTPGGTILTNTVTVGGSVIDTNPNNNTATADTTVAAPSPTQIDMSLTKTDSPDPVIAGQVLTYTLSINNLTGSSTATGVTVTDSFPAGLTFVSATPSQGTCGAPVGNSFTCNLGSVPFGVTPTITFIVTVNPSTIGTINNTATVQSNQTDPNPNNNTDTEPTQVNTSADLGIEKNDTPDPVTVGDQLVYILTITNNGPSDAANVVVTDTLPANVTYVSATPSHGSGCSETAGTVTCDLDNIADGANATITIVVIPTVATPAPGIQNTATVASDTDDSDNTNNTDTENTIVNTPPALTANVSIDKADDIDPVTAGEQLTYTITVQNNDLNNNATHVTVTDPLPDEVTYVSATPAAGSCQFAGNTVICELGTLTPGQVVTITLVVEVNPSTSAGTVISNTAVVSSENDNNNTDNSATEDTDVEKESDLSITKDDSVDPINPGGSLTYTLTVTNNGPSTATNVVITDTLPGGVTFVSASPGCTHNPGVVTCTISTLDENSNAIFLITVTVNAGVSGDITNNVSVTADEPEPDPDPNPNTDSETTTVTSQPVADLRVEKTDSPDPVTAGDQLVYTLTVTNDGPSSATNVAVTDTLPASATYVSATPSQGSGCSETAGTVTCNLGNIANGASATITIVVIPTVATPDPGIQNTATVASNTVDPDNSDNTDTENTIVNSPPARTADVSIEKADDPDPVIAGNQLTYTVTVRNSEPLGGENATHVTVTDPLPAGLIFGSAIPSQGICSFAGGTVVCELGDLTPQQIVTITISVTVSPSALAGIITNVSTVSAGNDDNPGNNTAEEDTQINNQSDLSITKDGSANSIAPGSTLIYTLTVINGGPSAVPAANLITVQDTLPDEVTFISASSGCLHDGSPNGGVVTCSTPGPLSVGSSIVFTINVIVTGLAGDRSVTNYAQVIIDPDIDPNPVNNEDTHDAIMVPTLSEWGMIIFVVLAGLMSVYYIRRHKRIES
jgi:large repetitive protein